MVRRVLLALVLGFLTTLAVAWTGAYFEHAFRAASFSETLVFPNHTVSYYFTQGLFITRNNVNWENNAAQAQYNPSWIDAASPSARAQSHAPYWSAAWSAARPPRPPATWGSSPGRESTLNEFAAGFPFRAFASDCDEPTQDPVTKLAIYPPSRGGVSLPCHVIKDGATIFLPRSLPYRPLPLGLAADITIFALLWTPIVLVPHARRAWRLKRGRCLRCGYDRRGLTPQAPCPECGLSEPAPAHATSP